MESLDKEQIAVYIVQGNHDPADSWKRHMPLPKNVHIFSSERVERFPLLVRGQEVAGLYGRSIDHSTQYEDMALLFIRYGAILFPLPLCMVR